jgi:flagellar basal body-associated protein FliL
MTKMNKTWLMIGALILILVVGVMITFNWLTFDDREGKTTITLDRNAIWQDVEKLLGREKK